MVCRICKIDKPKTTDFFYYCKKSKKGFRGECKECGKKLAYKWQKENPVKFKTDRRIAYNKEYLRTHKRKNPKAFLLNLSQEALAHRKTDKAMSWGFSRAFKSNRNIRWAHIVGYGKSELMAHIENQFTHGMTWKNYGKWHIDHKIPRAFFLYTSQNDESFKACWSLDNLQPLLANDNYIKANTIDRKLLRLLAAQAAKNSSTLANHEQLSGRDLMAREEVTAAQ